MHTNTYVIQAYKLLQDPDLHFLTLTQTLQPAIHKSLELCLTNHIYSKILVFPCLCTVFIVLPNLYIQYSIIHGSKKEVSILSSFIPRFNNCIRLS